jgi:aldose 1-epimerase
MHRHTLRNVNGIEAEFISFGATLTALRLPLADGSKVDVVLGFPAVADYERSFSLTSPPFLGAVVGLHAGRLRDGAYRDGDRLVQLEKNLSGKHHIHGGSHNLSNAAWNVEEAAADKLRFFTVVNDGKTHVVVEYALGADNALRVMMEAVTDESVLVNLTQHSYFNLDGHAGDVTRQRMMVNADETLETDADLLPTGRFLSVAGALFDFRQLQPCPATIDNSFVLRGGTPAVRLESARTGWTMEVGTNQPSIHVFVGGAHCSPLIGKDGAKYHRTSGICFEAQNFPDSPNHAGFRSGILRPGETYRNEIVFRFLRNDRPGRA